MRHIIVMLVAMALLVWTVGEGVPMMALPWLGIIGYALWNHEHESIS